MDFGITRNRWSINRIDVTTAHNTNCDVTNLSHWTFTQWTVCILTDERQSEVTSTHEPVMYDDRLWKLGSIPQLVNFIRAWLTQFAMLSLTCHVSALKQRSHSCVVSRPWLHRQLCLTAAEVCVISMEGQYDSTAQTHKKHKRMHHPTWYTRLQNNWSCLIRGTRHIWSRAVTVQTTVCSNPVTPH